MASEQKRKERQALITKALLLGYQIKGNETAFNGLYMLLMPDGAVLRKDIPAPLRSRPVHTFPTMWRAAEAALIHAGVLPGAKKPRRDTGVGSGKAFRLRSRRRLRGCIPGQP